MYFPGLALPPFFISMCLQLKIIITTNSNISCLVSESDVTSHYHRNLIASQSAEQLQGQKFCINFYNAGTGPSNLIPYFDMYVADHSISLPLTKSFFYLSLEVHP